MLRTSLLALVATLALAAPAHAAPSWLSEDAPFGDGPALQFDAAAAMAPDGTVVAARFTPDGGDLEVSERPPGGPAGPAITLPRVLGEPRPGANLQVLTGADGSAAVLFDAGDARWASRRPPGGHWSDPDVVALPGAAAVLAPDGELWTAGRSAGNANRLWVTRLQRDFTLDLTRLPVPPQGATDQAPAITVPSAGHAHVVFVEGQTTEIGQNDCEKVSRIFAIDVAGTNAGESTLLDVFAATGEGRPCAFTRGARALPPQLVASDDGSDTVAYAVESFEDQRTAVLSRHREAGGDWGPIERLDGDPQVVVEQLIGGKGAPVLTIREPGGLVDVTARRPGGGWDQGQLLAASGFRVEGVRTGTGSAVFAWTGGARVRGAVLESDGTLGNTVAIAPAQDLLGIGGDAGGDAVVLYSRPAGDGFALRTAGFDAAPPRITDVGIPGRGLAGEGLPFIVDADDVWGPVGATWDFGDGTHEQAIATGHEFAQPGERTVTVTVADAAGNTASASGHVLVGPPLQPVQPTLPASTRDKRAPRVSKLAVRGRTLTLTTDVGGVLTVKLSRHGHRGRTVGRTVGRGVHRITLPRLTSGAWRATITLTDANGHRSKAARLTVRVKRPRTRPRATRAA